MSNKQKVKPKRLLSLLLTLTMVLGMFPIMGTTTEIAYTGNGISANNQTASLTPIDTWLNGEVIGCDVNNDSKITIDDATVIQKYIAGLIDKF